MRRQARRQFCLVVAVSCGTLWVQRVAFACLDLSRNLRSAQLRSDGSATSESFSGRKLNCGADFRRLARTTMRDGRDIGTAFRPLDAEKEHMQRRKDLESSKKNLLPVRIDDVWYDLGPWRAKHPAGSHWIDAYTRRDATEVMYAFHSEYAQSMFKRLPRLPLDQVPQDVPDVTQETRDFRTLRAQLVANGWWERNAGKELREIAIWGGLVASGVALAQLQGAAAALSVLPLGLSFVAACWIAHDYVHAADEWGQKLRLFGPLASGLSPTWWVQRHNVHHAHTNEIGTDADIATSPQLFLWAPDPAEDNPVFRKLQPYLLPFWFSLIFVLWRISGALTCIEGIQRGRPGAGWEAAALALHWIFFLMLVPGHLLFASVLVSGVIGATIVTSTHQSEDMFTGPQQDWVSAQFRSTCDAATRGPVTEWLWGGMQYQVGHHLFPTMPRSRYPELRPVLAKFAAEHPNIDGGFRVRDEVDLVMKNFQLYSAVAKAPPQVGAPSSKVKPTSIDAAPVQDRLKNLLKTMMGLRFRLVERLFGSRHPVVQGRH